MYKVEFKKAKLVLFIVFVVVVTLNTFSSYKKTIDEIRQNMQGYYYEV